MACLPGTPCWTPIYQNGLIVYNTLPTNCNGETQLLSSDGLYYAGSNLPYTDIRVEDTITIVLEKIDQKLNPEEIFAALIVAIDNNPALKTILCEKIGECP